MGFMLFLLTVGLIALYIKHAQLKDNLGALLKSHMRLQEALEKMRQRIDQQPMGFPIETEREDLGEASPPLHSEAIVQDSAALSQTQEVTAEQTPRAVADANPSPVESATPYSPASGYRPASYTSAPPLPSGQRPAASGYMPASYIPAAPHPSATPDAPAAQTKAPKLLPQKTRADLAGPTPPQIPHPKRAFNEGWVGRNMFGIMASVLIYIGLLFLCVWAWNNADGRLTVALLFAISSVITGHGIALGRKKQNAFTQILTGCGFGAVFISIFSTHIYFHMLSEIAAYTLLFGWLVVAMLMTKLQQSVYLSIVAHLGMAISVCFAYIHMDGYSLAFLLVYQYVSIAILLAGNLLCYRKAYRYALLLSLGLTIVASCYMLFDFPRVMTWSAAAPLWVQFLSASLLSCLLSSSTAQIEWRLLKGLAHTLNKLMWTVMLFLSVYPTVQGLAANAPVVLGINNIASPILLPVLICAALVAAHIALTLLLRQKQKICRLQEVISVSVMAFTWFVLLLILWGTQVHINFPVFSYMVIPGLLMLLAGRFGRSRICCHAAYLFFAADLLGALTIGYGSLRTESTIALAAGYIVFYLCLLILMKKKFGYSAHLERIAIYFASGAWCLLLLRLWLGGHIFASPNLTFLFLPGLLLLGAGRISKNKAYGWAACGFFAADLLSVLAIRYESLSRAGVLALAGGYIVFYLCLIILMRKKCGMSERWEQAAIYYAGGVWFLLLLSLWFSGHILTSPDLTFLFLPGLLLLGVGRISQNKAYGWAACGFFAADLLSVPAIRYESLSRAGVLALAGGYIVFYLCLIVLMRKKCGLGERREQAAIYYAGGVWFLLLLSLWSGNQIISSPNLTFLFLPGLLLLGAGALSKNRAYAWTACGFFAADLLSVLLVRYGAIPRSGMTALAVVYMVSYLCLIIFMRKKLGFGELWERTAVYFASGVWLFLLGLLWSGAHLIQSPNLAFFFLPGLLLLAAGRLSQNAAYKLSAIGFLAIDLIFMIAVGYGELSRFTSVALAFGYMLLFPVVIWRQWPLAGRGEEGPTMPARLVAYAAVFVSLTSILLTSGLAQSLVILGVLLTAISVVLFLLHYEGRAVKYPPLHWTMRVMEYLLFAVCAYGIAFAEKQTAYAFALYWLLAVSTATVGFMRVRDVLESPNLAELIALCLKVTIIILVILRGFVPGWFNLAYLLSLASMISALLCVIAGFISRGKPLRLYGLFLTLLCVVKLITYDVRELETPLRIVALIGGGVICFVISALYSYSENKLAARGAVAEEPGPPAIDNRN